MDPGYQNVMDFSNVLPTALAFGIHVAMVFVQAGLAVFLIGSGAHSLFLGDRETPTLLRRLGVARIAGPGARKHGAGRVGLGILLGLPLLAGVSFLVSLLASSLSVSMESHLIGYRAEDSRLKGGQPMDVVPAGQERI